MTRYSLSAAQCRAARALLKWTQEDLAAHASVSAPTIGNFETETRSPLSATLAQLRAAFEAAGVTLIEDDGAGAGVRLRAELSATTPPPAAEQ